MVEAHCLPDSQIGSFTLRSKAGRRGVFASFTGIPRRNLQESSFVETRKAVAFDSIAMSVTAADGLIDVSRFLDKDSLQTG
jgi:hypothetical protein